jgi:hypothetical protein
MVMNWSIGAANDAAGASAANPEGFPAFFSTMGIVGVVFRAAAAEGRRAGRTRLETITTRPRDPSRVQSALVR